MIIISFQNKGPMTYTSEDGETTLYGVVSGPGDMDNPICETTALMVRVSEPSLLNWIKSAISKHSHV